MTDSITEALYAGWRASTGPSRFQRESLEGLEPADAARMEAQFKLQNYQEMVGFVANAVRKHDEAANAINANLR
jgi:hypothetical protein